MAPVAWREILSSMRIGGRWVAVILVLVACRRDATRSPTVDEALNTTTTTATATTPATTTATTPAAASPDVAPTRAAPTFAEQERALHEALAIDARDRGAFEGLAHLYYARGQAGDAGYLRLAQRVVDQGEGALAAIGQSSAELRLVRGLLALGEGRPDLARAAFAAALAVDPKHALAALNLARVELHLREPKAALEHLAIALRSDPSLALEVRLSEGVARILLGDRDGAVAAFTEARRLAPADPRPLYNLGVLAVESHGFPAACGHGVSRAIAPDQQFVRLAEGRPELDEAVVAARLRIDAVREDEATCEIARRYRNELERAEAARRSRYDKVQRERLLEMERQARDADREAGGLL